MKHFKLFFALFAMLALGVGNTWAQTVKWEKATSIAAGDVVVLVCESKSMELSSISSYGVGTAYTSTPAGLYELTVESGSSTGTFSFKKGTTYLYWTSGNSLATNATKNANTSWKVTFSDGNATILNAKDNARKLQWNAGSPRFACYTSNQTAVQLYKKVISDEPADVIVKTLKSIAVEGMTTNYETGDVFKFDGTCTATYNVTKNDEPQEDETKIVTPTVSTPDMNQVGTQTIIVSYTEDGNTVTTTYDINITANEVTPGTYTSNLNNVFFGCATGNNATEQSGKFDDVLVVAGCKSNAQTKTSYQSDHVRFYADSYLTISVPDGYVIKSIVFTENGTWNGSITASAGTYTDGTKTWTGNAQEVKFSFAAQNRIKSVKVTYAADVKYALNITTPSNGTLVVKDGSTVLADGAQVYEGTKLVVTPTPNAGYVFESLTVDGTPVDLTEGSYNLTMPAADVTISATFKENEKPAATLTLSMNGETEDITGYKQDDKVTLPETIDNDCIKAFVGWSANPACSTEPEYAPGDEYTLTATTQTLYAVYATVNGGAEATATNTLGDNGWTNESKHTSLQIDENVKATITGGSNSGKYYTSGTNWRLYQNENATITISTTVGELKSVKFTFTNNNDGTLLYGSTKLTSNTAIAVKGTSAVFTVSDTNDTENKGQIRFTAIEVVYTGGVSYSNYSTTCSAALTAPTFSLAEDTYTEAQEVTLSAEEGTIYYTLDGTTPDAESTEYIEPIVLDECGTTTIKAIAISGENSSPVTSATYTIKLPLNNSQANPYTEAEAIEVYNGGCYDNQDVYVKGVVANAQFYDNSGSYTITLEGGFQFYYFYEAAGNTKFTEDYIVAGDTLVACGKLDKHNSNYQLAAGCYLVERKPYSKPKVDISNTKETAYTVEEAIALIDDITSDLTKQVYVKGTVSEIVTEYDAEHGNITYNISSDGSTSSPQFQLYRGKSYHGEKFTSADDIKVGDKVVVCGEMKKHYSTYEMNAGNQLVALEREDTTTALDNVEATVTPVKAIINGQLVIVKDGVKFNALGQVIK